MGLTDALGRSAAGHAHALVVEVPGHWRTRAAVERAALRRRWSLAASPADADVLVVCGTPGPRLEGAIDLVWHQMPGPRVRVDLTEPHEVATRLDEAYARLLDTTHHEHDARHRPDASDLLAAQDDETDHGDHGDHGDHEDHQGHEGHGGHEDHHGHEGHGDMDMSPSGLPLAEGGNDRDGLEMDVLEVRLGPVLPHWPAGLVLQCSLQGDVITDARADVLDATAPAGAGATDRARTLDHLVSLLSLAGWEDAAAEARSVRDTALEPGGHEAAAHRSERLRRRVRRSWLLRRSLRGVRPLGTEEAHHRALPEDAAGDTHDRLLTLLDRAVRPEGPAPSYSPDQLAHLVTGLDLATARLVVASLDVQHLRTEHARHEVSHG